MNSDVAINRTTTDKDGITVYFTIPALNIDSQYHMTNDEFESQMSIGGFKQLGHYLVEQLENGLNAMLVDNPIESQTLVKNTNIPINKK